jgi:hypothetical protein
MQIEPLVLNSQWTAFIAGLRPPELIGGLVAPFAPADFISNMTINYWRWDPGEYLRVRQTQVSPQGNIPVADLKFTTSTFTLTDHGQQIRTEVRAEHLLQAAQSGGTQQILAPPLNSLRMGKLRALVETFWLNHEIEVMNLVHTAAGYDSSLVFNVGSPLDPANPNGGTFVALDDPDIDPTPMLTKMIDAPLIKPNTLVMGLAVWRPLQRNKALIQAVKGLPGVAQVQPGLIETSQLANYLGLKQVIVGEQRANFASAGAADSFSRIWGKNIAAIRVEPAPMSTEIPYPGSCLTAFGKAVVQLDENGDLGNKGSVVQTNQPVFVASNFIMPGQQGGGLYGAYQDIVGHTRGVVSINPLSGSVFLNCVSDNV